MRIRLRLLTKACVVMLFMEMVTYQTRHFWEDQAAQVAVRGEDASAVDKHSRPRQVMRKGVIGNYEPLNYTIIAGPGEGGEPLFTSEAEKPAADRSHREFGINMVASDKIAMNRTLPDTRLDECRYWHYPDTLPTTSVIIVFSNEGWSTLLRTVHSAINMTPKHLLHEVVLVDDFSDKVALKSDLDDYLKQFNGLVRLLRNPERKGLIVARILGAQYATGDVIVFLDAHCECNRNWLPPLLARIAYDRTIMAVPYIDLIDQHTLEYRIYAPWVRYRGIFEWGLLYKVSPLTPRERGKHVHEAEPAWSPTHAGGLFAMDRRYFFELGAYDPGLQIWGGENFELSFKIWQCGGSIEWVPCSRVGHIYRNHFPYGIGNITTGVPVDLQNYMRVVEVWLDEEFKEYFYTRHPSIRGYPVGDISKQLEFKKKHNCKSFKWFMENIAYDVIENFPYPPPNIGWGEIGQRFGSQCWDTMGSTPVSIGVFRCHHLGGTQFFRLNSEGQMAVGERCVDLHGDSVTIIKCNHGKVHGPWQLMEDTGQIRHKTTGRCTEASAGNKLVLNHCDVNNTNQQWRFNEIREWT